MAQTNSPVAHVTLGLLRIVSGFLFTAHGTQKLLGFPVQDAAATHQAPEMFSQIWVAGAIELVGGTLILLGLFTRPAAFLCSGLMAFAYFLAHADKNFWPTLNGGETAVLYSFLFLYLAAAGGGAISVDAMLKGKKQSAKKG